MSIPSVPSSVRVIILAAGKGARMKSDLAKVLTPVAGRPILSYLLASVAASDIDPRPVVVIGYKRDDIRAAIGDACEYVVQEEPLGTGHAVAATRGAVKDAKQIVVLYGDHPFISAQTIRRLLSRHLERGNILTLMTTTLPSFDDWYAGFARWGRILRGADGHISGIREYKDATEAERETLEVNPSLFCFDTGWLWENVNALRQENAQKEYYLTDLIAIAVAQGRKLSSIDVDPEEVVGINTPEEREIAESVLARRARS